MPDGLDDASLGRDCGWLGCGCEPVELERVGDPGVEVFAGRGVFGSSKSTAPLISITV